MSKRAFFLVTAVLSCALLLPGGEPADYWPQWRGAHQNGSSTTAKNLPVSWSETENVQWRVRLPSWSAATPIIWGDVVLVTSAEEGFDNLRGYGSRGGSGTKKSGKRDKLLLLAINRKDGSILWRRETGTGNRLHQKQNLASPSPVTDGKHIWVLTGSGFLSCFDFDGKQLWRRDIQKDYGRFGLNHGYASSPLLHGDRLYLQVLHGMKTDDPSYVFAVNKADGKTVWKVDRWTDAHNESPDNYSTPLVQEIDGKKQLIVSGGDYVTGHDLNSGRELWRMGGFNPGKQASYRTIASSIFLDGVVYTPSTRGRPFIAFRPGSGKLGKSDVVWKNNLGADVPTPTTDGRLVYVVGDKGIMVALDAKSGEVVWDRLRIEPGTYSASPTLADGKIYATSEDGTTSVLEAGKEFKVLAVNKFDSHTLASPAAAGNQLFIRTAEHLYCLAGQ